MLTIIESDWRVNLKEAETIQNKQQRKTNIIVNVVDK